MDDPTASAPPAATAEAAAPRRRWPWLLALLVLLGGAGGGWWYVSGGAMRSEPLAALRAELERLNHAQEQLRARLDTVRARLDDGDKVDQSVREQLLGLGERWRWTRPSCCSRSAASGSRSPTTSPPRSPPTVWPTPRSAKWKMRHFPQYDKVSEPRSRR